MGVPIEISEHGVLSPSSRHGCLEASTASWLEVVVSSEVPAALVDTKLPE